jgi:hypothetical protein
VRLAIVAAVLSLALLSGRGSAHAYTLFASRFDHACLTWDESAPEIGRAIDVAAVYSGITNCGPAAAEVADIRSEPINPYLPKETAGTSWSDYRDGFVASCTVAVRDGPAPESVLLHEFLHCLGLDHSDDPESVMFAINRGVTELTPDDVAAIQHLYGPRVQPLAWRVGVSVGRD